MTASDRPTTGHAIAQLLRLYQRRLVLQTGLPLALGAGCVAALSWRLWLLGVHPWLICGIGLTALAALGWWQWRALRRMWAARIHTPLALDRALGLEARLITAAEFADLPQPPPLYARLMEDPALVRSLSSMRLSPVADRRSGILAVALLLLLFWPWRAPLPQQLATQTPSFSTPPEIPPPPPQADQPQPQTTQRKPSGSQQPQSSGGSGSTGQPQSQQQAGDSPSGTSSDRAQSESGRADSQGEQGPSSKQSAQPHPDAGRGQQSHDAQPQHAKATGRESGKSPQEQTGKAAHQGSAASQQDAGQEAGAGQEKLGQRAAQTQPGAGSQQLSAAQPRPDAGRGQQEALKADIQQTLQQLSTELKQLQAELQQQRADQPNPAPGTSTDPELFEDASRLAPATGGPLPIQLDVDTQPTSTTRRGGGVGSPSTEAVDAPFQVESESAELAESGAEAPTGQRQAIPPEYRPVFERLSQQPTP